MPTGKKLGRALVASLVVNAFLLSLWGAHALRRHAGPPPPTEMVAHMTEGMSAADAALFRAALAPYRPDLEANHDRVLSIPARIASALAAPEFDPAPLKAALDDMRRSREAVETALGQATLQAAPAMSREGRMNLWHRHGPLHP